MRSGVVVGIAMAGILALATAASAVDGVIEINQARAAAGGVTSGDGAGFPVTLAEAGSYRLTGALVVPDGTTTAILIAAPDVSIDLNGFSILCADPCLGSTGVGIDTVVDLQYVRTIVRNGTVRGMGAKGVRILAYGLLESLVVTDNGDNGIESLDNTIVRGCVARNNGGDGIKVSASAVVESNSVSFNGGAGIFAEFGSVVARNSSVSNTGAGIHCVSQCNVRENSVVLNGVGIESDALVLDNNIVENTGLGISGGGSVTYGGNNLSANNSGGVQTSGGTEIGTNRCGADTTCP